MVEVRKHEGYAELAAWLKEVNREVIASMSPEIRRDAFALLLDRVDLGEPDRARRDT